MTTRENGDRTERPPLATSTRDLDDLGRRLKAWWASRNPEARYVAVNSVATPTGSGVANETILFDVAWLAPDGPQQLRCVARIEAAEPLFRGSDLRQHYRIIEKMREVSRIPVPTLHGLEDDPEVVGAPFYVMGRIDGEIPRDEPIYNESGWLFNADEEGQRVVWRSAVETLAELHTTPAEPFAWLRQGYSGGTGLEQDLSYWRSAAIWAAGGVELPVLGAAGEWLQRNVPRDPRPGLAWGDARYGNMIFRDGACVGVLDWDMASLAGADADLGWWVLQEHIMSTGRGFTPLPGLGTPAETLEYYEQCSGHAVRDLQWQVAFAAYRVCIAVTRAASMLAGRGILPPGSQMLTNNIGTQYLVSLLDLPPAGEQLVTWKGP